MANSETVEPGLLTVKAAILHQEPTLSDDMATAFAMLAMAEFRMSVQKEIDERSSNNSRVPYEQSKKP